MAHDIARAVPEPVLERAAPGIALPAPREAPDHAAHDDARPAHERAARDIPPPAPRPAHGSRVGWILSAVAAAAAAWAVGWVAGVSWAWREMTPRYLSRTHRRRGAGLPGAGARA